MPSKNFFILLDTAGNNVLGMGNLTEAELHAKVAELLASHRAGITVYDVDADAARKATLVYESLPSDRLSRKTLVQALFLRQSKSAPAPLKLLDPADADDATVVPFADARIVDRQEMS
jgi:hypothetical protein